MNRRHALFTGLATLSLAKPSDAGPSIPPECAWILGRWHSDVERSMASFTFEDKRPSDENLRKISHIFGKITHEFRPEKFILTCDAGDRRYQKESRFRISRFTSSSVSVVLMDLDPLHEMTLYRENGYYLVRSAGNFEYFKRVV